MSHVPKSLVICALTLVGLGVQFVSSAVAAEFHQESANFIATFEQDATEGTQKVTVAGSTLTCNEAHFEATSTTQTTTGLTLKPLKTTSGAGTGFSGCTFFGLATTVFMHTCDLVFNSGGTVDIAGCSGTEPYISWEVTFLKQPCEVRIGNQTGLSKATYTNIGSGTTAEVTTDATISGIKYDAIGSLCNPAGNGQTNGTYTGKLTATGEIDGTTTHTGFFLG